MVKGKKVNNKRKLAQLSCSQQTEGKGLYGPLHACHWPTPPSQTAGALLDASRQSTAP